MSVTVTADGRRWADAPCLPCCDDGSGSGGSGAGDDTTPAGACASAGGCFPPLPFPFATVPLRYCLTYPVDSGCDVVVTGSSVHIDANIVLGAFNCFYDGNFAEQLSPGGVPDPIFCGFQPIADLYWFCDVAHPSGCYKLTMGFAPSSGTAVYYCDVADMTESGPLTFNLDSDSTFRSFPATITLSPCAVP